MGAFLDRVVDVADGNLVFDFVVENCLERTDDLCCECQLRRVSGVCPGAGSENVQLHRQCRTVWLWGV